MSPGIKGIESVDVGRICSNWRHGVSLHTKLRLSGCFGSQGLVVPLEDPLGRLEFSISLVPLLKPLSLFFLVFQALPLEVSNQLGKLSGIRAHGVFGGSVF